MLVLRLLCTCAHILKHLTSIAFPTIGIQPAPFVDLVIFLPFLLQLLRAESFSGYRTRSWQAKAPSMSSSPPPPVLPPRRNPSLLHVSPSHQRTLYNQQVQSPKSPFSIPFSSSLGQQMLLYAARGRLQKDSPGSGSALCDSNKAYKAPFWQRQVPHRILQLAQRQCHVYSFGNAQRRERYATLQSGLDARSRALRNRLLKKKACTVPLRRLTWPELKAASHRSEEARVHITGLSPDRLLILRRKVRQAARKRVEKLRKNFVQIDPTMVSRMMESLLLFSCGEKDKQRVVHTGELTQTCLREADRTASGRRSPVCCGNKHQLVISAACSFHPCDSFAMGGIDLSVENNARDPAVDKGNAVVSLLGKRKQFEVSTSNPKHRKIDLCNKNINCLDNDGIKNNASGVPKKIDVSSKHTNKHTGCLEASIKNTKSSKVNGAEAVRLKVSIKTENKSKVDSAETVRLAVSKKNEKKSNISNQLTGGFKVSRKYRKKSNANSAETVRLAVSKKNEKKSNISNQLTGGFKVSRKYRKKSNANSAETVRLAVSKKNEKKSNISNQLTGGFKVSRKYRKKSKANRAETVRLAVSKKNEKKSNISNQLTGGFKVSRKYRKKSKANRAETVRLAVSKKNEKKSNISNQLTGGFKVSRKYEKKSKANSAETVRLAVSKKNEKKSNISNQLTGGFKVSRKYEKKSKANRAETVRLAVSKKNEKKSNISNQLTGGFKVSRKYEKKSKANSAETVRLAVSKKNEKKSNISNQQTGSLEVSKQNEIYSKSINTPVVRLEVLKKNEIYSNINEQQTGSLEVSKQNEIYSKSINTPVVRLEVLKKNEINSNINEQQTGSLEVSKRNEIYSKSINTPVVRLEVLKKNEINSNINNKQTSGKEVSEKNVTKVNIIQCGGSDASKKNNTYLKIGGAQNHQSSDVSNSHVNLKVINTPNGLFICEKVDGQRNMRLRLFRKINPDVDIEKNKRVSVRLSPKDYPTLKVDEKLNKSLKLTTCDLKQSLKETTACCERSSSVCVLESDKTDLFSYGHGEKNYSLFRTNTSALESDCDTKDIGAASTSHGACVDRKRRRCHAMATNNLFWNKGRPTHSAEHCILYKHNGMRSANCSDSFGVSIGTGGKCPVVILPKMSDEVNCKGFPVLERKNALD